MSNNDEELYYNRNLDTNEYIKNIQILIDSENLILNINIIVDYILILFCFYFLKTTNSKDKPMKCKLYSFFLVDSISSLIDKYSLVKKNSIPNELFISLLYSIQFLMILCYLEQISMNFSPFYNEENINPYKENIFFLFIFFSYDKLFSSLQIIFFIFQCLIILKYLFKYYNYLENKFNEIEIIVVNENNNRKRELFTFLENIPFTTIVITFAIYCLKLLIKKIKNEFFLYLFKLNIIVLKTSNKILMYLFLIIVSILINKNFNYLF